MCVACMPVAPIWWRMRQGQAWHNPMGVCTVQCSQILHAIAQRGHASARPAVKCALVCGVRQTFPDLNDVMHRMRIHTHAAVQCFAVTC